MTEPSPAQGLDRRRFLTRTAVIGLAGIGMPTLLAACGDDDDPTVPSAASGDAGGTTTSAAQAREEARAVVGDVIDFELTSDEWEGAFGFVTMQVHHGVFDGKDVYFVRTDASDERFATAEKLVFVPKLQPLDKPGLSGAAYLFDNGADDQPTVLSSEPGQDGFTPAWTIHQVTWNGDPRRLGSVAEVEEAERAGALAVEKSSIVVNYSVVKWSNGELGVDTERKAYLGKGQLLEPVDTSAMRATFKLSECYPGNRYFVVDHSMAPMAEMTFTGFASGLHDGPTKARATGRTNVFMNGVEGPGPMGFQPSVFDFAAGDPAWSPYWDHFAYMWSDSAEPRVITSQADLFEARDAGELEEFPGVPDTKGEVFTVNCPVPVLAPNTFEG
ncbi:MAG: DUF7482 domain-containing protein [Actinomycetota bacterium]